MATILKVIKYSRPKMMSTLSTFKKNERFKLKVLINEHLEHLRWRPRGCWVCDNSVKGCVIAILKVIIEGDHRGEKRHG